jgi:HEAT repeat protein
MESKSNSVPLPPDQELVEVRKPTSLLVAQFFLFPLIIIAICVGIFLLFGYLTYEQKDARAYLDDIRTGSGSTRWVAALELSNLVSADDEELRNSGFADNVLAVYINRRNDHPRVRGFLALTLGKLGSRKAVPALVEGLRDAEDLKTAGDAEWQLDMGEQAARVFGLGPSPVEMRDFQVQNQIYTLFALGMIGDNAAVPGILPQLQNEDPAVRKTAAYVLGVIRDQAAVHDLQVALNDPADEVRWNAAMALAQLNDSSGAELLLNLLDRDYLARVDGMTDEQKNELMVNAVKCLGLLKFQPARDKIVSLSQTDSDLSVRDASLEVLKQF